MRDLHQCMIGQTILFDFIRIFHSKCFMIGQFKEFSSSFKIIGASKYSKYRMIGQISAIAVAVAFAFVLLLRFSKADKPPQGFIN